MARMSKISKFNILDRDLEVQVAEEFAAKLNTKCTSVMQNTGNLSGGNQQKVLLAKWMFADPEILILDEPTRGIDVGAKYEIYCIINQLVEEGKTVLFISSEMPEILGISDRIYVMNEGKMVAELDQKNATQEAIMTHILQSGKGVE
jgi:putative multiple sugar transport system ATP-binding protein